MGESTRARAQNLAGLNVDLIDQLSQRIGTITPFHRFHRLLLYMLTKHILKPYLMNGVPATRTIINEAFAISSRYRIILLVLEVPVSKKFPTGIKAKFVMVDSEGGFPRLLIDNHEPLGFHMHTQLPEDSDVRLALSVTDYNEALTVFLKEVERIIDNEQS